MGKHKKEPALLRKTPNMGWIVSRDWIGWYVLHESQAFEGIDPILDVVAERAPAFIKAKPGVTATVSRDGKATVTFSGALEDA